MINTQRQQKVVRENKTNGKHGKDWDRNGTDRCKLAACSTAERADQEKAQQAGTKRYSGRGRGQQG